MPKPFVKINLEDLEYAKEFFENVADYSLWLYAVTEYYQGREVVIKKKLVKKYFNNYKKTMNIVIDAKKHGQEGYKKKIENQAIKSDTLEGGLEDTLAVNNKVVNNKDINIRKQEFADTLKPFLDTYGKDMLNEFYQYWVEHSANAKKLRFEKEKVWGLERRLSTWHRNKVEREKPSQIDYDNLDPLVLKAIELGYEKDPRKC
jgi:hypothetical protein